MHCKFYIILKLFNISFFDIEGLLQKAGVDA